MALWAGTLSAVSEVGGDLQLNEGASFGRYDQASTDIDGYIGYFNIEVEFEWEESPADQGIGEVKLLIDTSDVGGGGPWDGYRIFKPGEYVTRFYRLRVDFHGNAAENQRPKLTRLEPKATASFSEPRGTPVLSTLNNPPANPDAGDRHIVGTGAAGFLNLDGKIVTYIETTSDTFIVEKPHIGKKVHHIADAEDKIQDASLEWVSCDARTTAPYRQTMMGQAYESTNGLWAYVVDRFQDSNGYFTNQANDATLDHVDYNVGLLVGSYDLRLCTMTGGNGGILKIYIDPPATVGTTLVATFDLFAGNANNVIMTQAAIAIAVAGTKTVRLKVDGNSGSGGHEAWITWVEIWPT